MSGSRFFLLRLVAAGLLITGGVALLRPGERAEPTGPPRPPILVYLVDALRADHLSCYGHGRETPAFDAFAADAIVFQRAFAQSSWTRASVASIFTGLWPYEHGANRRRQKLSAAASTLPEILAAAGYQTAAFVTNPNVTPEFGFDQGFGSFTDLGEAATADHVTAAVLDWLDAAGQDDAPFFLYVHTIDPHNPYLPPSEFRRRFAPELTDSQAKGAEKILNHLQAGRLPVTAERLGLIKTLYEAEVAYNDQAFATLIAGLKLRDLYDQALILVLSDHGEEFNEHRHFRHGKALFEESLHVPLMLRLPAAAGRPGGPRARSEPVQHTDLLPTLLAYLGLPAPETLDGRNLLADEIEETPIFSYLHLDGPPRLSVRHQGWSLIAYHDRGQLSRVRLYDLVADPGETINLAEKEPVRADYLASLMRQRLASRGQLFAGEEATPDDELRQSLRALGYLE